MQLDDARLSDVFAPEQIRATLEWSEPSDHLDLVATLDKAQLGHRSKNIRRRDALGGTLDAWAANRQLGALRTTARSQQKRREIAFCHGERRRVAN
jgi:hypothetical protein